MTVCGNISVIPAKAESHKLINNYKKVELIRDYYILSFNEFGNIIIFIDFIIF
jgi:hypothetical protein